MPASAARASKVLYRFAPLGGDVALADDECLVTVCTSNLALDDDVWVMEGIDLSRFLAHPVALRDHDMTQPVARASDLEVTPQKITARATFPPPGISPKADETRGLVKAGIITGVSAGIIPLESEPLDPRNPRGGRRITRSILIEFSFVSVPSDAVSGVTARSRGEDTVADEQTAAREDRVEAETGAEVEADGAERAIRAAHRRMLGTPGRKRGLYEVASLCYLMAGLNYQVHTAKAEAALEGDESEVPGMLLDVLHGVGAALVAMTQEEVEEMLDGHDVDEDELDEVEEVERAFVRGARSPKARAFRLALVQHRAGKAISKTNAGKLEEADGHHDRALKHNRGVAEAHDAASDHLEKARAEHRAAEAAVKDGGDGSDERALKHIRAAGEHLDDVADAHADAGDGCRAATRSVRAASRCVRAVLGQAGRTDDADPEPATDDENERQRRARALQLKAKALAIPA